MRHSIWPAMHPRLLELVKENRSTLIFVNARRLAERLATRLNELHWEGENRSAEAEGNPPGAGGAGQGAPRLALARAAAPDRGRAQVRSAQGPGRHLQPRAGHRHGRRRPRHPGRVARRGGHGPPARRPGRPPGGRAEPRQALPQAPGRPARGGGRRRAHAGRTDRGDPLPPQPARRPLPADRRHVRARRVEARRPHRRRARRRRPSPSCPTRCWPPCSTCCRAATRPRSSPSCGPGSCGTGWRAWCGAAPGPSASPSPTRARSPTGASSRSRCPTARASASSTRRWSTSPGPARRSCSARPPGASRTSPSRR